MKIKRLRISFLLLIILVVPSWIFAQTNSYYVYSAAFYNVENLFDTNNDPDKNDEDFLPEGSYKWTENRYNEKQERMSGLIARIGSQLTGMPPTVLGLSEIENKKVIEDLINQDALKKYPYKIAHIDSPDARGVDVGFIYNSDQFKMEKFYARELWIENAYEGFATRNQLVVEGELAGEKIAFIVNHWPSRRAKSPYREAAGELNRSIIDSLRKVNPNLHCITMGDFNDDPVDKSIVKSLGAVGEKKDLSEKNYLYNPMYKMYKSGLGTLAYRDKWNLFDQIIITKELKENKNGLFLYKAEICNYPELKNKEGRYKGYPFRTYAGGNYAGGYSDHFPVVIYLVKEK